MKITLFSEYLLMVSIFAGTIVLLFVMNCIQYNMIDHTSTLSSKKCIRHLFSVDKCVAFGNTRVGV